jgi:drug/metabolite transporter (DMT)-like permease
LSHHWGYVGALGSAILFGLSSTLNKISLNNVNPIVIAGMTYLVGGIFLFILHASPLHKKLLALFETTTETEHEISKKDYKTLGLVILFGSVLAPLFLLQGLNLTTAVNASLLLTTEALFTAVIAFTFLGERGVKKDYFGIILLLIGVLVVTTDGNLLGTNLNIGITGNLLVLGACLFWGLDNTFCKFLSKKTEIIYITALKCLIGGGILLAMPLFLGISYDIPLASLPYIITVGAFSIALSILLFLFSLREIGSMRTGAIYSVSSLFGAVFAFFALGETFSIIQLFAGIVMLLGVYILYKK